MNQTAETVIRDDDNSIEMVKVDIERGDVRTLLDKTGRDITEKITFQKPKFVELYLWPKTNYQYMYNEEKNFELS